MAKTRSPRYPAVGLEEAIEKAQLVYEQDYQNKVSKQIIAEHMGYQSLNGKSLGVIAALSRYGLIEGRGAETGISDLALAIIAHAPGSPERIAAIKEAAEKPELFVELDAKFQNGKASDSAIRSYLLTKKFIPEAADNVVRSYRETKNFVAEETLEGYGSSYPEEGPAMQLQTTELSPKPVKAGTARAEFPFPEGMARLEFPSTLSPESYSDLEVWVELLLRRAKRSVTEQSNTDE